MDARIYFTTGVVLYLLLARPNDCLRLKINVAPLYNIAPWEPVTKFADPVMRVCRGITVAPTSLGLGGLTQLSQVYRLYVRSSPSW
jgi:hypothetical protein